MATPHPPAALLDAEECRKLLERHQTVEAIAKHLGSSVTTVRKYLNQHGIERDKSKRNGPAREWRRHFKERFPDLEVDQPDAELLAWPTLERQRLKIWRHYRDVGKLLVLADAHVPFQRTDLILGALERDGDADLAVFAGDFFDAQALSRFHKHKVVPFRREWEEAKRLCHALCSTDMPWLWIRANHERRLEKILSQLEPDAYEWVAEHLPNLLEALVQRTQQEAGKRFRVETLYDWWLRIGDAAICHADEFSSVPARTATGVADWMRVKGEGLESGRGIKVIVQAHSHHQAMLRYQGKLCLETGCLGWDQDYALMGKLGPGKKEAWQRGYVVLYFEGGVCDWNRSRFVSLDVPSVGPR